MFTHKTKVELKKKGFKLYNLHVVKQDWQTVPHLFTNRNVCNEYYVSDVKRMLSTQPCTYKNTTTPSHVISTALYLSSDVNSFKKEDRHLATGYDMIGEESYQEEVGELEAKRGEWRKILI